MRGSGGQQQRQSCVLRVLESEFCPWQGSINWRDSGYCHDACHDYTNASEVCKALAAGCGANLRDMSRGDRYRTLPYYDEMEASATRTSTYASVQQCDASVISSGQCELCRQPVWCVDNNGRGPFDSSPISTAQEWIDAYEDGWGETIQDAQCKFQRGQKRLFIDASVAHWSAQQRSFDHWTPRWNEVNVFIEEASQEVLVDSLVGLFHVNGDGSELLSVADHLSTLLGWHVPVFTLTGTVGAPGVACWAVQTPLSQNISGPVGGAAPGFGKLVVVHISSWVELPGVEVRNSHTTRSPQHADWHTRSSMCAPLCPAAREPGCRSVIRRDSSVLGITHNRHMR